MDSISVADIAIVGLGQVGGKFFAEMLKLKERGVNIVCAAQNSDTPGKQMAVDAGIGLTDLDGIVAMGAKVDIIFDMTGNPAVRRELRQKMVDSGNRHTVIAPESVARLLWCAVSDTAVPTGHASAGYA